MEYAWLDRQATISETLKSLVFTSEQLLECAALYGTRLHQFVHNKVINLTICYGP